MLPLYPDRFVTPTLAKRSLIAKRAVMAHGGTVKRAFSFASARILNNPRSNGHGSPRQQEDFPRRDLLPPRRPWQAHGQGGRVRGHLDAER